MIIEARITSDESANGPLADSVRLDVRGDSAVAMTAATIERNGKYKTIFSADDIEEAVLSQPLAVPPGWDVRANGTSIVATYFGGATASLVLIEPASANGLPTANVADDLARPRFARRDAEPLISAIRDSEEMVVYRGAGPPAPVMPAADALLIRRAYGYSLFWKPSVHGVMLSNGARAGLLQHRHLDENLAPVGPVSLPLGETEVFEFDADEVDGRVAVAGTTPDALLLAIGSTGKGTYQPLAATRLERGNLTSPAVAIIDRRVSFAAIHERHVITGKVVAGSRNQ